MAWWSKAGKPDPQFGDSRDTRLATSIYTRQLRSRRNDMESG